MQSKNFSIALTVLSAIFTVSPVVTGTPAVAEEKVLYAFKNNHQDGTAPYSGLLFDASGNLYGTTPTGGDTASCYQQGNNGCGVVYELIPAADGTWTEKILHDFSNDGIDGSWPSSGLIFDAAGSLYGTTGGGGAYHGGTVFELSPQSDGSWTETVLHDFGNGTDGWPPLLGGLTLDAAGNLYGTTERGGTYNCGTVFELTPEAGGWTETILHNFANDGKDGTLPGAGLIFDSAGNLYGTTVMGGTYGGGFGYGTVFELTPAAGGLWTETVIHSFGNGTDGVGLQGGLIFDSFANLYGATFRGGAYSYGTVFELTLKADGRWAEKVLHSFNFDGTDGVSPGESGLVLGPHGNLYGTTLFGGASDEGTVFRLTPHDGRAWTEKVLSFGDTFRGRGGTYPVAGLILDAAGNLYGTTRYGGVSTNGVVFEIEP